MRSKKTQYMTFMAMFLAIEIILVVTPLGYIPIGPLSATTMHIPVIIAGITLGKKAGAQLGLVFGLTIGNINCISISSAKEKVNSA